MRRFPLVLLLTAVLLPAFAAAIKFDIPAVGKPTTKCIWNYALTDTLVIVTINSGEMPDSAANAAAQELDVEIVGAGKTHHVYLNKKDVKGETRMALNTHSNADLGVCLTNKLRNARTKGMSGLTIDLDVDIGADAVDYNAIANQESLSGLETEMRKLEAVAQEILDGMDYLKKRELKMRGTNESTNSRVQNFATLTLFALLALGAWQMLHLRAYFKRKYLID